MTTVTIADFIDESLRPYSAHSNVRAIPFIGDGFKQAQRKAVEGMLSRGENASEDTVERISAAAASRTDYHHGAGSMADTMVGMAQTFAGSNNVPIFEAIGQFGSRLNKKNAAPRYIKTKLAKAFRQIFRKEDDILLERMHSNGIEVEPKFFIPVLPLVLINGANGMGTGHSTNIMSYDPAELKAKILQILKGKKPAPNSTIPFWRGFSGSVTRDELSGQIIIEGKYEIKKVRGARKERIVITELPIGLTKDSYKTHLEKLEDRGIIETYDDLSDKVGFEFIISAPDKLLQATPEEIKKTFKLIARESENLTVWDSDGILRRFECVEDLLENWVSWRVDLYEKRRLAQLKRLELDIAWADEKVRFIEYYIANHTWFRDTSNKDIASHLEKVEKFERVGDLLDLPMRNLTKDKIAELKKDVTALLTQYDVLLNTNAEKMFNKELAAIDL